MSSQADSSTFVASLSRGLDVIRAFDQQHARLTLSENHLLQLILPRLQAAAGEVHDMLPG